MLGRERLDPLVLAWGAAALGTAAAYALGLSLDVMEVDAAQYAAIARDMAASGSWLELTDRGQPFLNKPPLLFWASALSFRLFGVSNVAYRLPSLLAFVLGIYSTYRIAAHYGGARAGRWSALVLATCQGAFLMNHDVRTDTMLLGLVAFALWQLARFLDRPRPGTAFWLGLALGGALLTKGTVGLAVPLLGAAAHIAVTRRWSLLRRPEWGLALGAAGLLLVPMLAGVVRQHGVEGLRFHLWTQGLGRVLDENIWGDAHGPLYFIPQLAWIFLPWTLFFGLALWTRLAELRRLGWRLGAEGEALTTGAFVLGFIGLSLSRSKLPHYVYVLLPAAAVMTGSWIAARRASAGSREGPRPGAPSGGGSSAPSASAARSREPRGFRAAQLTLLVGMVLLAGLLALWAFPPDSVRSTLAAATPAAALALAVAVALRGRGPGRLGLASVLTIAGVNVALNAHLYPALFSFQAGSAAGRIVAERAAPGATLAAFRDGGHAFDFYARRTGVRVDGLEGLRALRAEAPVREVWGLAGPRLWDEIRSAGLGTERVAELPSFRISKLTAGFLDPRTRPRATSRRTLFRIPPATGGDPSRSPVAAPLAAGRGWGILGASAAGTPVGPDPLLRHERQALSP